MSAALVPAPPTEKRGRHRLFLWVLVVLALFPAWRLYDVLLGRNFHVVAPGHCYRGAQPSPAELADLVRRYHIRTIINLRGITLEEAWYHREMRTTRELGAQLVNVGMWSNSPPEVPEFRNLIRTLSEDTGPFFIHCYYGSDRTGLASALFMLLRTDATLPEARQQLGLYYGHIPRGRASCQDGVLDSYEAWLKGQGLQHAPLLLRRWGLEVYDGT